jgi:acetyl esterase/lipase
VLGGLNSEQSWCRHVCNNANMVVVDVAYRMAPEYLFPVAIYDCWDALKWVSSASYQYSL